MFAVIKTGGKQYKVEVGSLLKVEKLAVEVGNEVTLEEVLMVGDRVGTPFVSGAKVVAEVKEHGKGKKVINFKYNKKTYYRKKGHRQQYTLIEVKDIKG